MWLQIIIRELSASFFSSDLLFALEFPPSRSESSDLSTLLTRQLPVFIAFEWNQWRLRKDCTMPVSGSFWSNLKMKFLKFSIQLNIPSYVKSQSNSRKFYDKRLLSFPDPGPGLTNLSQYTFFEVPGCEFPGCDRVHGAMNLALT